MVPLTDLWLPILLSAVFVFVASSILHMVLPYHKSDYRKLPEEDRVLEGLRSAGVNPGRVYHFPHVDFKELKKPEVQAKFTRGPVGMLTVVPSGPPTMGKSLGFWFLFCLIMSLFVAYVAGRTLAPGTQYLEVFRVAGAAAFVGYGVSQIQDSIWKYQTWGVTFKHIFDGLIYALVTAGTFGWLWPK
jgi:hypothetical protein